jgi:hypothetical protein
VKIQNQLSSSLIISDQLKDSVSQFQSGVKYLVLNPLGSTGDSVEIPDSIAEQSAALQVALTAGQAKITGIGNKLGADFVPGLRTFTKVTPVLTWARGGAVLFAAQVPLDGGGVFVVNFSGGVDAAGVLADGNLEVTLALDSDYVVVVTQQGGAPVIIPRVSAKTATSFTITGDAAAVVSVLAHRVK